MNTILIHTTSKQQAKLFEDLANALGIGYEVGNDENSQTDVEKKPGFMREFNEALETGFSVEESRKRTLSFVDNLWRE